MRLPSLPKFQPNQNYTPQPPAPVPFDDRFGPALPPKKQFSEQFSTLVPTTSVGASPYKKIGQTQTDAYREQVEPQAPASAAGSRRVTTTPSAAVSGRMPSPYDAPEPFQGDVAPSPVSSSSSTKAKPPAPVPVVTTTKASTTKASAPALATTPAKVAQPATNTKAASLAQQQAAVTATAAKKKVA